MRHETYSTPHGRDQRAAPRRRALKGAKIVFNGSVLDCMVRNVSERGARVSLPSPTPLPDRVALHMPGGAAYQAQRKWTLGGDSGFAFDSAGTLQAAAAARALALHEGLAAYSPAPVLAQLLAERCFDDRALQDLALKLGEAHAALAAALGAMAADTQA